MSRARLNRLICGVAAGLLLLCSTWAARSREAFLVSVTPASDNVNLIRVDFDVAPGCVLYAERLHFLTAEGDELVPLEIGEPSLEWDKASGHQKKVYEHPFSARLKPGAQPLTRLVIKMQGCTNGACFAPEERVFQRQTAGGFVPVQEDDSESTRGNAGLTDWTNALSGFRVVAQQTGYLKPSAFSEFLARAASGKASADDALARFAGVGLGTTILLIVLGGFLLNFTPCVLPMIPINLAVIGAGSKAQTRAEGMTKGGVYGAGMALAYGMLGLAVVLTGAKFGALNSSFWFNVIIALVFVVMGLGMFDLINIDLSRFRSRKAVPKASSKQAGLLRYAAIFSMGSVAALLAGACVAPVVVSALLLAASFYGKGMIAGLFLPFLLGLGMALPWPIAGAGLAVLPKPGNWMKHIKRGFGVMIFAMALYYGHVAYETYPLSGFGRSTLVASASGPADPTAASAGSQADQEFVKALERSRQEGVPVFVDFHASWCKNCLAMDATVFNRDDIRTQLGKFIVVRYAAEQPNRPPAKGLLDHFGVIGLPTYLVVTAH